MIGAGHELVSKCVSFSLARTGALVIVEGSVHGSHGCSLSRVTVAIWR